jgi:hypothetical protein
MPDSSAHATDTQRRLGQEYDLPDRIAGAVIGYLAIALYYIIPFWRLSAGFLPKGHRSPRPRA